MSDSVIFTVYFLLFELIAFFPGLNQKLGLCIVLFNLCILLTCRKKQDVVLLSSFILGSEILTLINILLYASFSRGSRISVRRPSNISYLIALAIVSVSLALAIIQKTVWNFVFGTAMWCLIILLLMVSRERITPERMSALLKKFLWLEFAVIATIFAKLRDVTYYDSYYGTVFNSHTFANWLILTLAAFICNEKVLNNSSWFSVIKHNCLHVAITLIMVYLASAKVVTACAVLGLLVYVCCSKLRKNRLLYFILGAYCAAFFLFAIIYTEPIQNLISELSSYLELYLYNPEYNGKFEYIRGTFFDSLKGVRLVTGYGLGQYGSRFANAFAYDAMLRTDNTVNNFISSMFNAASVPEYVRYISYYSEEFVGEIAWRSAVLSYPFNSFVALIAEIGLIGVFFFAYAVNKEFGKSGCQYIVFYFLLVCVFDSFLDNMQCVGPLIVYMGNIVNINCNNHIERKVLDKKYDP